MKDEGVVFQEHVKSIMGGFALDIARLQTALSMMESRNLELEAENCALKSAAEEENLPEEKTR